MFHYLRNLTGVSYLESVEVTENDHLGPLPSVPTEETDYFLWFSWIFILTFCVVTFARPSFGKSLIAHAENLFGHTERVHIE